MHFSKVVHTWHFSVAVIVAAAVRVTLLYTCSSSHIQTVCVCDMMQYYSDVLFIHSIYTVSVVRVLQQLVVLYRKEWKRQFFLI